MSCSHAREPESIAEPDSTMADLKNSTECQTILLVEDEAFVRDVTCEILQSMGYQVLKARNAIEAMCAFHQHQEEVRLLITDVVMPGQNGRDLAQQLRALRPDLKALFISG